jgi:hypothetical protein
MYKHLCILAAVLFLYCAGFSQNNIAGIWEGQYLSNAGFLGNPKLVVEIFDVKDSSFSGVTHLYYAGNKYEHYKMIGWYSKKDSLLVFRESETIAVDLGIYSNCLGTYKMVLKKTSKNLFLHGRWDANIKNCTTSSLVWLQKKIPAPQPSIVQIPEVKPIIKTPVKPVESTSTIRKQTEPAVTIKEPVAKPQGPVEKNTPPSLIPEKITQRTTDLQQLIEVATADKDSIKIEIYDNGEIDGDTISLYYDKQLLINKKLITDKALTFYVNLTKASPISHLRLVAESLGSIPPCTALMVVSTKHKRYEVRLSSNFKTNAAVELFLKE